MAVHGMTGSPESQRPGRKKGPDSSIWTEGRTWIALFLIGSALLAWGILSLPLDGAVRGMILFVAILAAATACCIAWLEAMSNTPLPVLNPTPRIARVREIREWDNPDTTSEAETKKIIVEYSGDDGQTHTAWLGDLVHESSIDRFTRGSCWQVYAFADPEMADTMVLLTEEHDDVWRNGYMITGVHENFEFLAHQQPAPGSPFLNGKRRFAS